MNMILELDRLRREVERLKALDTPRWVYLAAPLTSTAWDGDSYSTSNPSSPIDLSAVFGVPAAVKAILAEILIRDSGSAAGTDLYFRCGPSDTYDYAVMVSCHGAPNDAWENGQGIVPCDAGGDIYYQIVASGTSTMDIVLRIWGYLK